MLNELLLVHLSFAGEDPLLLRSSHPLQFLARIMTCVMWHLFDFVWFP